MYDLYQNTEFKLASVQRRIIAYILDLAIISGITTIVVGFLYLFLPMISGYSLNVILAVMILVIYFFSLFYFIIFELLYGQTLAKIILGLYVYRSDLSLPSFENILLRNLMRVLDSSFNILMLLIMYSQYIGVAIFLIYPIGIISMISLTDKHQRIGDFVGNTIVVQKVTKEPMIVQKPINLINEFQNNLAHLNSRYTMGGIPQQTFEYYKKYYEDKINEYKILNLKRDLEKKL